MKNILLASALACTCMSAGYAAPMLDSREAAVINDLNEKLREKDEQIVTLLTNLRRVENNITILTANSFENMRSYAIVKSDNDALIYLNAVEEMVNALNRSSDLLELVVDRGSADVVAAQLTQASGELRAACMEAARLEKEYPDASRQISGLIHPIVEASSQRLIEALQKVGEKQLYNSAALKTAIGSMVLK